MTIATYSSGPCNRPRIRHDNGFLDKFAKRGPTVAEHLQYQWWVGKLEVAEAAQKVPFMPHNDISDALAAYRHFLEGTGNQRWFSYERYVANDPSGKITLENAIADAQGGAWEQYQRNYKGTPDAEFDMISSVLSANSGSARFPYPSTENWQKAIGAHNFWICAHVKVSGPPAMLRFAMEMTVHVEDMYNFNPGAADIATGIPDAANGIFEITGLAKQYLNVSQLSRTVEWIGKPSEAALVTPSGPGRDRQPSDNRRARNRL
jgi:hypothetical protein